ncbi:MAG TPA: hypothetical protein VGC65_10230, partial [Bacteroidia bacterium]
MKYSGYLLLLLFIPLHAFTQGNKKVVERNGKVAASYTLKNGRVEGEFTQFYPNGLIQAQGINTPLKKSGEQYWYYPNDKLRMIVEYSITYSYFGNYSNYFFNETVTEFWENGKNKSLKKYINGKAKDELTLWYANGNMMREYKPAADGKHFIYAEYYENGQKKETRSYLPGEKTDVQDGLYQKWNEKGILTAEASIQDGKNQGYYRAWTEQGQLTDEDWYEKGLIQAQKRWSSVGELIISYDKRDPENNVESVSFHADKKTISNISYFKTYTVGDSVVKIRFSDQFDTKGVLKQSSAFYKKSVAVGWFKNNFALYPIKAEFVRDSLMLYGIQTSSLEARIIKLKDRPEHVIRIIQVPAFNEGFYSDAFNIPVGATQKKITKIVDAKLKKIERWYTNPEKVNPLYLISKEKFPLIRPYALSLIPQLLFTSVVCTQHFDASRSGDFIFEFTGTKMKCTGTLKEGLLHGNYIVYLNDSIVLCSKPYQYGVLHGKVMEYYPNGLPSIETEYVLNRKIKETSYYFNGGKRKTIFYNDKERSAKELEWYENGIAKSVLENIPFPKFDQYSLREDWYPDGSVKHYSIYKDSVLQMADLFENGEIKGFSHWDYKKEIYISKSKESEGRIYMSVKIPPQSGLKTFEFEFEKYDINIKGKAAIVPPSTNWSLEDNLGKKTQVDFSQLSFSENLPCACEDWTKHEFFMPSIKDKMSEETFLKYQLHFHKPLAIYPFIFGDPYYTSSEPEKYTLGKTYSFSSNFVSYNDIVIPMTDSSGILFSLTPCRSKYAFASFSVSGEFRYGFPAETKISIYDPKTMSITFNSKLLRQVNEKNEILKNSKGDDLPGMILFNGKQLNYNSEKELDVIEPGISCSKALEVT